MGHIIINLNIDGYNFWIRAMAMMRIGASEFCIRFYDADDVIYSLEYLNHFDGPDGPIKPYVVMEAGKMLLSIDVHKSEIFAVAPCTDSLWSEQKQMHSTVRKDFEDSLKYEDPREEL